MWIKTLQVRLIITLSLYRKRAKYIYIIKEYFHWQSSSTLKKLSLKSLKLFTLWNKYLADSNTHLHVVVKRDNSTERGIQLASEWRKQRQLSDDSSERLWLVIAFISSTGSCVIGYNVQRCKKRVCLWLLHIGFTLYSNVYLVKK